MPHQLQRETEECELVTMGVHPLTPHGILNSSHIKSPLNTVFILRSGPCLKTPLRPVDMHVLAEVQCR